MHTAMQCKNTCWNNSEMLNHTYRECVCVCTHTHTHTRDTRTHARTHTHTHPQAIALMIVAVAGFTLILQSVTPLNLLAGPLFGLWKGTLVFTVGATAGAVLCYVVGKNLVSGWARRQLESSPSLRKIDAAVRTDGLKIIILARLSPLAPFAILSYVLGATGASLGEYTVGTFIGLLPGVALYCWIGNNAANAASSSSSGADGTGDNSGNDDDGSKYLSLAFSVIASVVASTLAKRALDSATEGVAAKQAD
jgi:uncharacterized membrane protein YdjX (TVP38/TMEM64 family)